MTATEQKLLSVLDDLQRVREEEREALMSELQTISEQQKQIIELLSKQPPQDSLKKQLEAALLPLLQQLANTYHKSNQQLLTELKSLFELSDPE